MEAYLSEYLKTILFPQSSSGRSSQAKKYTDAQQDHLVQELLKNTVRIQSIPFGKRFAEYGQTSDEIMIVLKGQALVKIPFDKFHKQMSVKDYLSFVREGGGEEDPDVLGELPANQNIIHDYNLQNPLVLAFHQEKQNQESFRDKEFKNYEVTKLI